MSLLGFQGFGQAVLLAFLACTVLAGTTEKACAGTDFGTRQEAENLAEALIRIIDAQGVQAAANAVYDPEKPFVHSPMGVNLFLGSMVIADNREPEMISADYSQIPDLTGKPVWPRIASAAAAKSDTVLKWYHYDTQEHYDFHCASRKAVQEDAIVMVCR